ncbi:17623_t:CDS:2, partial [Acaulospora morrowiae]
KIVDQELEKIGAQKLLLPILLSANLWKKTGRWDAFGTELFQLRDRKDSEFCLAPTHEEEITQLVSNEVVSYRQLPLRLYQIGRKYRDEMRPRLGLLRGREFIMKDLYT